MSNWHWELYLHQSRQVGHLLELGSPPMIIVPASTAEHSAARVFAGILRHNSSSCARLLGDKVTIGQNKPALPDPYF